MLDHLHALESFGKHIDVLTKNLKDQRERTKQALHALKTARASLQDALKYGMLERQVTNINQMDLPLIEDAITRLEMPAIKAPKVSVPPSKFSAPKITMPKRHADYLKEKEKRKNAKEEGPVACGGLLRGEDLEEDKFPEAGDPTLGRVL